MFNEIEMSVLDAGYTKRHICWFRSILYNFARIVNVAGRIYKQNIDRENGRPHTARNIFRHMDSVRDLETETIS